MERAQQQPQDHSLYISTLRIGTLIYASAHDTEVNITTLSWDELDEHVKNLEMIAARSFSKKELPRSSA
jgi:hypothetical protein